MTYRILVTGSSGFIGKALVTALAAQGHHVRAAARRPGPAASGIEHVMLPNIARPIDWTPFVKGMDLVVHLAGIAHRRAGENVLYDQANRGAAADLAAACQRAGVKRLVFASSMGAQAGSTSDRIQTENDSPRPVTDYDRAKLAAEDAIRRSGVDYAILRPVILYGAEPKANIALMVKLAALPIPLPFGAFKNRRSLLALDNFIAATIFCLDGESTLNQTFVVSDPEPITLAEMFAVMRRAQGRKPHLVPIPPVLFKVLLSASGRARLWDQIGGDLVVNPRKLLDAGWQPVVTTEQGLAAMVRGSASSNRIS